MCTDTALGVADTELDMARYCPRCRRHRARRAPILPSVSPTPSSTCTDTALGVADTELGMADGALGMAHAALDAGDTALDASDAVLGR